MLSCVWSVQFLVLKTGRSILNGLNVELCTLPTLCSSLCVVCVDGKVCCYCTVFSSFCL